MVIPGGKYQLLSGTTVISTVTQNQTTLTETCGDVVGNYPNPNGLVITKERVPGPRINGTNTVGTTHKVYTDFRPVNFYAFPPSLSIEDPNLYRSRALASNGPLSSRVNVPLFVYELKDLPRMLRHAGDLLHKVHRERRWGDPASEAASATLAYQFGWAPIVEDMLKMLDLSARIEQRHRDLRDAHSTKGLRRRTQLGTHRQSKEVTDDYTAHSGSGITVKCTLTVERSTRLWATVRWRVRDPLLIGKPPPLKEVRDILLGFRGEMVPVTVWKALPWTWFADWFFDVSNYLQATANMVHYVPKNLCIMQHSVASRKMTNLTTNLSGVEASEGEWVKERKARNVYPAPTPLPTIRVPYLDAFKLSILGSMTILRIRGR